MRLSWVFMLGLLWLVVMVTSTHTEAHTAGRHRCCTGFSKVKAERLMHVRGKVRCRWQAITEGCNLNAVVLNYRRLHVCVNPRPQKMRNLLQSLCNNTRRKTSQRKRTTTNG